MDLRAQGCNSDQSGAMAVCMVFCLVVLLGVAAVAIDYGHMTWVKNELQKAADAGALAGARFLAPWVGTPATPNWISGQNMATQTVLLNHADGQTLTDCQVNYGFWSLATKTLQSPGIVPTAADLPAVQVTITKAAGHNGGSIQMLFGTTLGVNTFDLSVQAVAIVKQAGSTPFDYTIFSGSSSDTLPLNGSQTVKGSAHANYKLTINGSCNISAAAEGAKGVSINGSNTVGSVAADTLGDITINGSNNIGSKSGDATNIAMPDYTQQIANVARQVYNSNQTFNGAVDVAGSIYVNGNVILNGSINSTGAILADGNITVNGSSSISGSNQVCLYSANGNITVNGTSLFDGSSSAVIYAPNGTVIINGSINFHGRVIGKKVIINGSGNFNGTDYPVTSLPTGGSGQSAALVK